MFVQEKKFITKKSLIFDTFLSALFFIYMTDVCAAHAPAQTVKMQYLVGAFTAICLTGVFWMAVQFFRVTIVDQLNRRRNKN